MAVQIQIIVDDDQKVHMVEAGSNVESHLVEILEGWKQQAVEPCSVGQKCKILQQWIADIENLLQ